MTIIIITDIDIWRTLELYILLQYFYYYVLL